MHTSPTRTKTDQLFASQNSSTSFKSTFFGLIHTIVSKVLFALLTPLALLAVFDLLRSLEYAKAREFVIGDVPIASYILIGLLLWIALLVVTDLPGGGKIITRVVWGLHVFFNIVAIPFWILWQPFQNESSIGFPGLGWLASLVIFPVLAVSSTCFFLSCFKTNYKPPQHEQPSVCLCGLNGE